MRGRSVLFLSASLVLLQGATACYEYQPLASSVPPVGEPVALVINDAGRLALSPRFGPGLEEVQGTLVSADQNEFIINVARVSQINAGTSEWSGEQTHISRADVGTLEHRQLNVGRTVLLAVGIAAVASVFLRPGALSGSPDNTDQGGGGTTVSNRAPVGISLGIP